MTVEPKRILLVSMPFYGHALPMLQLGQKLSSYHSVTFAVPDFFLAEFRKEFDMTNRDTSKYPIQLMGIEIRATEAAQDPLRIGNKENGATMLRNALTVLYPSVRELFWNISTNTSGKENCPTSGDHDMDQHSDGTGIFVDLVIVDTFFTKPATLLQSRGIPYYLFNTARVLLAQILITLDIPGPEPYNQNFAELCAGSGKKIIEPILEKTKDILQTDSHAFSLAEGIIHNSLPEADGNSLDDLIGTYPNLAKLKMIFICPVNPEFDHRETHGLNSNIMTFLDSQTVGSVVYISFGSIAIPGYDQIQEICRALLQMKIAFIWSLPAAHHVHLPDEMQLEMRNSRNPSYLVLSWTPQREILAHPSTGIFLSHCGWNSTMESLAYGVPIISWPMFADQFLNGQWLEKEGIAKLVRGTGTYPDRLVPATEIMNYLTEVPGDMISLTDRTTTPKKNPYKVATLKWRKIIQDSLIPGSRSHDQFMRFVNF